MPADKPKTPNHPAGSETPGALPPSNLSAIWRDLKGSLPARLCFLLRNEKQIRSRCLVPLGDGTRWVNYAEFLGFIGEKCCLLQHTFIEYPPCGPFSLREPEEDSEPFHIRFRIDPNTVVPHGVKRGVPNLVLESVEVWSRHSGQMVSIPAWL